MLKWIILPIACLLLSCKSGFRIEERVPDPTSSVELLYSIRMAGGAAGSVGHCFVISKVGHPNLSICDVLGSSLNVSEISWTDNVVSIDVEGGTITRFRNGGKKEIDGKSYFIKINQRSEF